MLIHHINPVVNWLIHVSIEKCSNRSIGHCELSILCHRQAAKKVKPENKD